MEALQQQFSAVSERMYQQAAAQAGPEAGPDGTPPEGPEHPEAGGEHGDVIDAEFEAEEK